MKQEKVSIKFAEICFNDCEVQVKSFEWLSGVKEERGNGKWQMAGANTVKLHLI